MKTTEFFLPSRHDQLPLSVMLLEPEGPPIGIFQISHGMCEHKERYLPLMEFLGSKAVSYTHLCDGGRGPRRSGDYPAGRDLWLIRDLSAFGAAFFPDLGQAGGRTAHHPGAVSYTHLQQSGWFEQAFALRSFYIQAKGGTRCAANDKR